MALFRAEEWSMGALLEVISFASYFSDTDSTDLHGFRVVSSVCIKMVLPLTVEVWDLYFN